jgi:hypothetical protein
MPSYSAFLRRLQLWEEVVGDFQSFTQAILNFFIVDSTPFELCKRVRSWRSCLFEEHADWAISATKKIYGIKLHLAIDDLNQVVNFFITKGSTSDVSMAAKLLQGRTGTAIGDKGYVSKNLHMELKNCGLNFIARAKRNMKEQNTAEEIAALSKRYKVKIFTGKLKTRLGDNVAHFRPWKAVSVSIGIALMTMNLGF